MKQSKNKTLLLLASPHRNGVSAKMLEVARKACEERGDEITFLSVYDLNLKYCLGCRKCLEKGDCVMQNDDGKKIANAMRNNDTIVIASPTYWGNVPAPLKNMFDRLYGVAMEETSTFPIPRLKGKKYALLVSCNTPNPFAYLCGESSGTIRVMKEFGKYAGMKCLGCAVIANTSKQRTVTSRVERKISRLFA